MDLPCAYVHFSRKTMNTKRKSILQFFTVFRLEIKWLKKRCKSIYLLATHRHTHTRIHTATQKGLLAVNIFFLLVFVFLFAFVVVFVFVFVFLFDCKFLLQLWLGLLPLGPALECAQFAQHSTHTVTHSHTHTHTCWQTVAELESSHFA